MPLDPVRIASALELNGEAGLALATRIKEHIEKTFKVSDTKVESLVMTALGELGLETVGAERPDSEDAWLKRVDESVSDVQRSLGSGHAVGAGDDRAREAAYAAMAERQQKRAEEMEKMAPERGLPTYARYVDRTPEVLKDVDMTKVVARRLGENQALCTHELSTCTGVSLFDPVTKVGAMMHVYDETGEPTIESALAAMKAVDTAVDPRRLQVAIMPGESGTGNKTHREEILLQLARVNITHVRDLREEGQISESLYLRGDGMVIAATEAESVKRARSESVDSVHSLPSPAAPVVSGMGAGLGTASSYPPPPPKPKFLPDMPSDSDDDLDGPEAPKVGAGSSTGSELSAPPSHTPETSTVPEVGPRKRSPSVGEALGLGKYKQSTSSEGLGLEGPSTGSRVGRSKSF